jgi:hypothetical protein
MPLSEDYRELHELLTFGFNFQDALIRSLEDGKIDFTDIGNIWPLATSAGPAFKGVGNPLSRLSNLTELEREALIELARQRFDLPNDMLELLIEDTIREVYGDYLVAKRWSKYFAKPVVPTEV